MHTAGDGTAAGKSTDLKPVVVITGASGGIGEELAYQFARGGEDVLLVARSGDGLARVAAEIARIGKGAAQTLALDLTAAGAAERLDAALAERGLYCDVLVNNAGFGAIGGVTEIARDKQLSMIDLNIRILTDLSLRFVEGMIARGRGGIINLASTASFQPGPFMAVYYATKAYVLSFSEALHYELKDTGVKVTAICPGPTITGFQQAADFTDATKLTRLLPTMGPEPVAQQGYAAFKRNRPVKITGVVNTLMARSAAFTPRAILMPVVRWLQT